MRVTVDAFWLYDGPPSGRNVVRSLVREWAARGDDEVVLRVRAADAGKARDEFASSGVGLETTALRPHALAVLFARGNATATEVFVTQNFTPLLGRGRSVTFVHDVIYRRHPRWFTPLERAYLRLVDVSVRRASHVVTSSEAERSRIEDALPAARGRTTAVGLAPPPALLGATPRRPAGMGPVDGFVLAVGRLNVRKNLHLAAQALLDAELATAKRPLVVVGERDGRHDGWTAEEAAAISDGRIVALGGVPDGELRWLYEHCSAFVFPSLDEAFGLPVLEALAFGAPVALSDIPAFREFGDVGAFFDPTDPADLARAVRTAVATGRGPGRAVPTWSSVVGRLRQVAAGASAVAS